MANRDQFLVNSFMTKPTISNLPGVMPPQDAMQRMEQLKHEYFSRENFHHALLEYWMTNSGMSQIFFRYTLKTCTFKLAIFIYRGKRYKVQDWGVYKAQKGGVYKLQDPENFSEKGRL